MDCPECNKKMELEYGELEWKEWFCGDCEIYVEKDGNKIRIYHLHQRTKNVSEEVKEDE